MGRFKLALACALGLGMAATAASVATAADDAKSAIEARKDGMKTIGKNNKAIGDTIKGEASLSPAQLAEAANAINAAAKEITVKFKPEFHTGNAGDVKTTAKPEIWQQWDKFAEAAKALEDTSAKLAIVAAAGDMEATRAAFADNAKNCGACHRAFRVSAN